MNLKEIYENKHLLDHQMEQMCADSVGKVKPLVIFPPYLHNLNQIEEYSNKIEAYSDKKKLRKEVTEPLSTPKTKGASEIVAQIASSSREKFIQILQTAGVISSKAKMQSLMEENGFSTADFEQTFDLLKDKEGILMYSKSAPRGYSIETEKVGVEESQAAIITIEGLPKPELVTPSPVSKVRDLGQLNEAYLKLIKENQPVSSKTKLLELGENMNLDKITAEKLIEQFKELGVLQYSKSSPRGWLIS